MTPTLQLYLAAMKPSICPIEGDKDKGHKTSIMYEVSGEGEVVGDGSHYIGHTFARLYVEDECIRIVYCLEIENTNLEETHIKTRIPMIEASLDGVVTWIYIHNKEADEAAELIYPGVEERRRSYYKKQYSSK